MEVSEIKDRDRFKTWLQDKPKEWALVLAARIALRVAPLAWSVAALSEGILEKKFRENLTLLTFRANFISSAARRYPADDMKRAAADAFGAATANSATTSASSYATAAIVAASAAGNAADAADAAAFNANCGADAYASTDSAMASTSPAYVAASFFWDTLRADCDWLEAVAEGNDTDSAKQAQALSNQPLWMKLAAPDALPMELEQKFHQFNASELAQTTSFGLITDWYKAAIEGKSAFGKKAELAIAKMSPEDWGDEDEERDCIVVMDRVEEIAGWSRDMTRGGDFYLDNEEQEELYDASRGG